MGCSDEPGRDAPRGRALDVSQEVAIGEAIHDALVRAGQASPRPGATLDDRPPLAGRPRQLVFDWLSDEVCVVAVDMPGRARLNLGELTYDDLGWGGMRVARDVLLALAGQAGFEVAVEGTPGI
jgi:hypothetical protein